MKHHCTLALGILLLGALPAHAESCTASHFRGHRHGMLMAHRTAPMGARAQVCTRWGCGIYTVDDRGPFVRGRCVDIETSGAGAIGLTRTGVAPVTVTWLSSAARPLARSRRAAYPASQVPNLFSIFGAMQP